MNTGRKLERMTVTVERAFDIACYGADSAHAACFGSGMAASSLHDCVREAFCDDGPKFGGFAGKTPALVACKRRRSQRRASIHRSVYPAQHGRKWNESWARRGGGRVECAEERAAAVPGLFDATNEGVLRISIQAGALQSTVMWPVQRCTGFVTPMVATTDSSLQCIESKRYFNTGIWHASCNY